MNRFSILAAALVAVSGAASANTGLAGDITIETRPFVSSRSPDEVRAELHAFKKAGAKYNPWNRAYNPLVNFKSEKTRTQVTADYVGNRDAVAEFNGEDSGSMYLAETAAAARRAARMAGAASNDSQQ
jgi:hypothetical protein